MVLGRVLIMTAAFFERLKGPPWAWVKIKPPEKQQVFVRSIHQTRRYFGVTPFLSSHVEKTQAFGHDSPVHLGSASEAQKPSLAAGKGEYLAKARAGPRGIEVLDDFLG